MIGAAGSVVEWRTSIEWSKIREKLVGGKMAGDKLERLLNENGREGRQLRTITSVDVKGRSARAAWKGCW